MQIDRPSKRSLFSLLLFFILITLLIYQFRRLSVDWHGYNMGEYVRQNTEFDPLLFLLTILLMPINWSLETWQWLRLMRYKSPLSFRKAFSCVLAGISVSMFTPNRVGEFAGRILLLSSNRRSEVIVTSLFCSLSQWIAISSVGVVGFFYLQSTGISFIDFINLDRLHWVPLGIGLSLLLLFTPLKWKKDLGKAWKKWMANLGFKSIPNYPRILRGEVLAIGFIRYFIYSLQYVLLCMCFGASAPFEVLLSTTAFIFLAQMIIPLPPAASLVMRANLALWIWSYVLENAFVGLISSYSLFIINFGICSFLGVFYLVKFGSLKDLNPFKKRLKNENSSIQLPPPIIEPSSFRSSESSTFESGDLSN